MKTVALAVVLALTCLPAIAQQTGPKPKPNPTPVCYPFPEPEPCPVAPSV